jgi:AraC-like DNA-binding protein
MDFLDDVGAPVERGLERHKLPQGLRERPSTLLSTRAVFAFVAEMARREGIEDFGWRGASSCLDQLSLGLVRALQRAPTLLNALETMSRVANRESSNLQVWLARGRDALFFCHRGSIEVGALGSNEANTMRTALIIYAVRVFTATDWVPAQCGLAIEGEIGPFVREELRGAQIRRAPDYGWLRLPRPILAQPPRTRVPEDTGWGAEDSDEPPQDLVGSLVRLLRPYVREGGLSLPDAAHLAGTSARTLQRELACAGSSYRDIFQRVKFDAARELLQQRDVKIIEVANDTGFIDPAHFTRFFQRFAGVTPREYRATRTEESN